MLNRYLLSRSKILAKRLIELPSWRVERRRLIPLIGRHRGQRCFIIGNGPSILRQDLTLLREEVTFVTNHFLQHPQLREILPSYFCASDPRLFRPQLNPEWLESACNLGSQTKIFFPLSERKRVVPEKKLDRFEIFYLNFLAYRVWERKKISVDILDQVNLGDTVVIDFCLPLAFSMGFSEVYLVGVDCNYGLDRRGGGGRSEAAMHFYDASRVTMERRGDDYLSERWFAHVMASYKVVRELFEAEGRRVLNATRGGRLEVFPRVSYEEIVGATAVPTNTFDNRGTR